MPIPSLRFNLTHTTGHLGDTPFQAMNCTGNNSQTETIETTRNN